MNEKMYQEGNIGNQYPSSLMLYAMNKRNKEKNEKALKGTLLGAAAGGVAGSQFLGEHSKEDKKMLKNLNEAENHIKQLKEAAKKQGIEKAKLKKMFVRPQKAIKESKKLLEMVSRIKKGAIGGLVGAGVGYAVTKD